MFNGTDFYPDGNSRLSPCKRMESSGYSNTAVYFYSAAKLWDRVCVFRAGKPRNLRRSPKF
ncbi:hypothetical protein NGHG_00397 [Neisseria gonorrhoeae PID1]|uniref:Uncharacterized protein n=1 Tax=Neisseria gonorrhoeae (strain NCCP11945) TaxID=521006 RepID=B4RLV6_NEIG2|nr:Conserved hypothetical protein [Neisseria gonorrhoeae NCCP11945]EEZ52543.1 hypothetical protein NGHG_00397 [Neisseria gonorrhoeae PID1]EFE04213.1 conserved hypothetical protein [Neisseria gonorrhoeae DGI2]